MNLRRLTVGLAALTVASATASAQDRTVPKPVGANEEEPVPTMQRRGFPLFGIGDFAITGMRQGGNSYWKTTAMGPSDDDLTFSADLSGRTQGTRAFGASYANSGYFEIQLWMAASRGDWSRNRDIVPALENVKGGGWSARTQFSRWTGSRNNLAFTGKDGSVGTLFSGVTSTADGSCRDNSTRPNAFVGTGLPLLAASDCPDTWAGPVFAGERPVPDSVWLNEFRRSPSTFTFNDWKIPASRRAQDKLYGSFQTFGSTVDYGREKRAIMGSVIPGQSGAPIVEGYPLGIEWAFDAWSYAVPTVADAMLMKYNIVNRSADVYGVGLDYDSLYLGFMVRPLYSPQSSSVYADISRGLFVNNMSNVNGTNCYGANRGANVTGGYSAGGLLNARLCLSNATGARGTNSYLGGAMVLKSPIGDLRNKKFTDPTSPFFNPAHPNRGDTITFNHMSACGFTCVTGNLDGRIRATYGAVTSNEADVIAGTRPANDYANQTYFDMFHNMDFPTRWSPSTGNAGGFPRMTIPGWDYDKDGKDDTLKIMTCTNPRPEIPAAGCVPVFSDTLLGGFPNTIHNNYFVGVGPVKLKAGDTTSFTVAFLGSPDSLRYEALVGNLTALYQNFWLSPEPPCPMNIVSAVPTGGNRQFDTFLRLYFDQQANDCEDKFLLEQARVFKTSTLQADIRRRVLNPRLINNIRKISLPAGRIIVDTVPRDTLPATVNACSRSTTYSAALCLIVTDTSVGVIDSMLVFKSCDNGNSFTATTAASCLPAPARDPAAGVQRYPWQSYARLVKNAAGRFPATFTDGSIAGGLNYVYVVVGQSFPASWPIIDVAAGGQVVPSTFTIRPATLNGLSTNTANRNVASVYIPVSRQAGADSSLVDIKPLASDTVASYNFGSVRLAKAVTGAAAITGRIILSDSASVEEFYATTAQTKPTRTTVRLMQLGDSGTLPATRRYPVRTETFTLNDSIPVDIAGLVSRTEVIAGGSRTVTSRFRTAASRPLQATLIQGTRPLYVTDTIDATDVTPPQSLVRNDFQGLVYGLNLTSQRALRGSFWGAPGLPRQLAETAPTIGWVAGTVRDTVAYARYRILFAGKEYGAGAPFQINRANAQATRDAFTASIAGRTNSGTTVATAAAASAMTLALGRTITTDSLAVVNIPFGITNTNLNKPVAIAILKNAKLLTARIGDGADTIRVDVSATSWIPNDQLYFIETFKIARIDTVTTTPLVRRIRLANGIPDSVEVQRVTWGPMRLACATADGNCNPVTGVGGTGHILTNPNQQLEVVYYRPVRGMPAFDYSINPEVGGTNIASVTKDDLKNVNVVPNPYIMFSQYEQTNGIKRLMFTNLPPIGTLRIYTASGQMVQQIKWTAADLQRNCRATVNTTECRDSGDLLWNMRTREDLEIGPGFYVFVVSTEVGGKKAEKLGKFVVIQ